MIPYPGAAGQREPALFFGNFYAFRTALRRGYDKTISHPADHAGKSLKLRDF